MMISTSEGGMIWASVPEAAITPDASAVIAVAQHDGQRDQAHRDHRGGHHAGGGGQHGAHQNHGQSQAAADGAEQLADGVEQVLGHAAALKNQAHQREERNGQQRVVLHDAVDTQRQACISASGNTSSSMPMKAKNRPQAPG
jgi:hypothetical protein